MKLTCEVCEKQFNEEEGVNCPSVPIADTGDYSESSFICNGCLTEMDKYYEKRMQEMIDEESQTPKQGEAT